MEIALLKWGGLLALPMTGVSLVLDSYSYSNTIPAYWPHRPCAVERAAEPCYAPVEGEVLAVADALD